jgi:MFS family permease
MSNIFLSTSLIFLASEEAGCLNEEGDEVLDDCDEKVYGFKPISLISNIAIMTGVLSALFMPIAGAMIDYTPFRRQVGILVALFMVLVQAVQIGTVSSTWFAMAMLQAVAGFLYQIQVLAVYAYLPDIATIVGQQVMTQRKLLISSFGNMNSQIRLTHGAS